MRETIHKNLRTTGGTAPSEIGRRARGGAVWLVGQTVAIRAVNFLGQIVLAWLLMPDDFALIALAYTFTSLISLLEQLGLRDALIYRSHRFGVWQQTASTMAVLAGVLTMILTVAAAPLAGAVYGDWRVAHLICILALAAPLNAAAVVPAAKLQADLRFAAVAATGLLYYVSGTVVTVVCAWAGWGAYSFAIAQPASALLNVLVVPWIAGINIARPSLRRWRWLVGTTAHGLYAALCERVIAQSDYVIMGLLLNKTAVGFYYFAFNLSMQAVGLLTVNLVRIGFPSLASMRNEPARQERAFSRMIDIIGVTVVPLCFLQAALARPIVLLLFGAKWEPAVPILQILSIGMAFKSYEWLSAALLRARGLFTLRSYLMTAAALSFIAFVVVGTAGWGVLGGAVAVSAFYILWSPLLTAMSVAGGSFGKRCVSVFGRVARHAAIGVGAVGAPWGTLVAFGVEDHYASLLIVPAGSGILLATIARWCEPQIWGDVTQMIRRPQRVAR